MKKAARRALEGWTGGGNRGRGECFKMLVVNDLADSAGRWAGRGFGLRWQESVTKVSFEVLLFRHLENHYDSCEDTRHRGVFPRFHF